MNIQYRDLLHRYGTPGFRPDEIVAESGPAQTRKGMPPTHLWHRIREPLLVANILRERMIDRGASGLMVRAAYRPHGGAARSAHKVNEALDLDLIGHDVTRLAASGVDLRAVYAEESVRMWCEIGENFSIGLGHYGSRGSERTWRVHIDTTRCRSWQHAGSSIVRPPSTVTIAKRLGLRLPTDTETGDDET
jgi:hypothetical protein